MQAAKPEERAGELEQPQEVRAALVVAHQERPALGQPRERPFDDPPARREALLAGRRVQLLLADAPDVGHVAVVGDRRLARRIVIAFVQA